MKATILLATLKKEGLSNTQALSEFLRDKLAKKDVEVELVKLVEHAILPGTYSDMGTGDAWPHILKKVLASDLIVFATPVWWGSHSSEMQKVIERLDEIHDNLTESGKSALDGKVGGIVVTGDSDGAEHIIGTVANFFNAIGIILPPYATLTVLWEGQAKGKETSREELMQKYEKEYGPATDKMVEQMLAYRQKLS